MVVVARDAAGSLRHAVEAVLPDASAVVLAVDPADTATWAVASELVAEGQDGGAHVTLVANPGGTAAGLNVALAQLETPIVARIDAHTVAPPGYLPTAAGVLRGTGAAVVGGLQVAEGVGPVGRAVAAAMQTLAGSGGARHRRGGPAGPNETAYLGVFDRGWIDRVGGYDATLHRNQDYEICHRIRQAGGVVWFDPSLAVRYRPRESWAALATQYHEFGRFKRRVMVTAPRSVRLRQLVPASLPVALLGSAVLAATGRRGLALAAPTAWSAVIAASATTARAGDGAHPLTAADRTRVAVALAVMHLSWGTGFWRGGR